MKKEKIMGIEVCIIPKDGFVALIKDSIRNGDKRSIISINPEKILKAKKDKVLLSLLNTADYTIPDGVGILVASRLKRGQIKERITGIDSMEMLCAAAVECNFRIFLYGAKPTVADKTKMVLEQKYQGIQIVGCLDGYYMDNTHVIQQINDSNAEIVFVAMGSPKQEYWIENNRNKLNAKIFQGVGGSFDVICGNIKRAPAFFREHGLEWFFRLLLQPKRIFRMIRILKFFLLLVKDGKHRHED